MYYTNSPKKKDLDFCFWKGILISNTSLNVLSEVVISPIITNHMLSLFKNVESHIGGLNINEQLLR